VAGAFLATAAVLLSLSVKRTILIDDISWQEDAVVVTLPNRHFLVQWSLCFGGGSMPVSIKGVPDRVAIAGMPGRDTIEGVPATGLSDARQGQFRVQIIDKTTLGLLTADGQPISERVDASMGSLEVPLLMGLLCTGVSEVTVAVI
jgi:hypothetical protein